MPSTSRAAGAIGLLIALLALTGCVAPPPADEALGDEIEQMRVDPRFSTVRLRSTTCEGVGVGSGFVIDRFTIVTNRHVIEGAEEIVVETWQGRRLTVSVAAQGGLADLAVIRLEDPVDSEMVPVVRLAGGDPDAGTDIRVFGYPQGGPLEIRSGTVDDYITDLELGNLGKVMRSSVQVEPGNSGGPVLNEDDRVVGVVYAIELATDRSLIIPVSTLERVLADESTVEPVEAC